MRFSAGTKISSGIRISGRLRDVLVPILPYKDNTLLIWDGAHNGVVLNNSEIYNSVPNDGSMGNIWAREPTSRVHPILRREYQPFAPFFGAEESDSIRLRTEFGAGGSDIAVSEFAFLHNGTSTYTLTLLFNTPLDGVHQLIGTMAGISTAGTGFNVRLNSAGTLAIRYGKGSSPFAYELVESSLLEAGEHILQIVKDEASISVYVNGTLIDSGTLSSPSSSNPDQVLKLGSDASSHILRSFMPEMAVHNFAMNTAQLEGVRNYLAEKWTFDDDGPAITVWPPEDSLVGPWFSAAETESLFQDDAGTTPSGASDPVGRWKDLRGNAAADGRQSDSGLKMIRSTFGGKPTVFSDGDKLLCENLDMLRNIPNAAFMLVFVTTANASQTNIPYYASQGTSDGTRAALEALSAGSSYRVASRRLDGAARHDTTGGTVAHDTAIAVIAEFDFVAGVQRIYINNGATPVNESTPTVGLFSDTDSQFVNISGVGNNSETRWNFNGHLMEILVFRRMPTKNERIEFMNRAASEWGVGS